MRKPSFEKAKTDRPEVRATRSILVAEDDPPLAGLIGEQLEGKSYTVDLVHDGIQASSLLECRNQFDLLILDLNLPKLDGIGVLQRVRPNMPRLPVLVLSGRTRVEDKVRAFQSGADDYLVKPFSLTELIVRVQALLRRNTGGASNKLQVGDLTLYPQEHKVERNGRRIELTPREFAILDYMMRNARRPIPRMTLFEEVWKAPYDSTTNVVDVYMKYVRDKVDLPGERPLTHTIRGIGYELSDE